MIYLELLDLDLVGMVHKDVNNLTDSGDMPNVPLSNVDLETGWTKGKTLNKYIVEFYANLSR